jgi:DNA-binding PadR family transcriptional regulator
MAVQRRAMTDRAGRRSTLGLVVLALLEEAPMHVYRMHELIRERGKESVVNVAQRNSVYQTIERLVRAGLVEVEATTKGEGRPERVVYRNTEAGTATLRAWLADMLRTPAREFPEFPAALAFLALLAPREVTKLLEARRTSRQSELAAFEKDSAATLAMGLPRLFLLEDDYRIAMLRAEIAWLDPVLADLRAGELTWSKAWIKKIAAEAEKFAPVTPKRG